MITLNGITIVSTDWHFGLKGNSTSRLNICVNVVKEHIKYIKENNVKNLIFCGDLFHQRENVNVNVINVALKCVQALAKICNVYLICGNHDCFLKNSTDINSLNIFKDTPNVIIIDKPQEILLNDAKCLFVPWLSDLSKYEKDAFEMAFGHFDIKEKFLIDQYVKENTAIRRAESSCVLDTVDGCEIRQDPAADVVDTVRRGGIIWAGHIHKRNEFKVRGRDFIFVGSPYQQTLADVDCICGFYVIGKDNKHEFVQINGIPRHVIIKMSDAVKKDFDLSCVAGQIIQKLYDIDVSYADETKIMQKINDFKPYEELLPEYQVALQQHRLADGDDQLSLIRKSKLEYIKAYVERIEDAALAEQGVERDQLFNTLQEYYNRIQI